MNPLSETGVFGTECTPGICYGNDRRLSYEDGIQFLRLF
jgi:hypothetical protein